MMSKRGQSEFAAMISHDALDLLSSVDDQSFVLVPCIYVDSYWRGCNNILFTQDEPLDARGNISVFIKLI